MILTITPNTALDRIEILPTLSPGKVLRSTSLTLSAGGKGVNVARAIKNLGGVATCAGILGGYTGRLHAQLVSQEGIQADWTWIGGETRAAIVIVDEASGETTVINEDGPAVTSLEWEQFQSETLKLAQHADAICLCGSLPRGLKPEYYSVLVQELVYRRKQVWVDSSGPALQAAVHFSPTVVKVNGQEAAGLLGCPTIEDVTTAVQAAQSILRGGFEQVVLTLGKIGAVLASKSGVWYSSPPTIKVLCPIGSGDAFLGGLVLAWIDQNPEPVALRWAVAAGSANALSVGGGKFTRQEFEKVLENTSVEKLV